MACSGPGTGVHLMGWEFYSSWLFHSLASPTMSYSVSIFCWRDGCQTGKAEQKFTLVHAMQQFAVTSLDHHQPLAGHPQALFSVVSMPPGSSFPFQTASLSSL